MGLFVCVESDYWYLNIRSVTYNNFIMYVIDSLIFIWSESDVVRLC
jgi:hypothetical protein